MIGRAAKFYNLYSHLLEEFQLQSKENLQIAAFRTSGIVLLADNPKLFLGTFRFNSSLMINVWSYLSLVHTDQTFWFTSEDLDRTWKHFYPEIYPKNTLVYFLWE